jgi:hypothetical protein
MGMTINNTKLIVTAAVCVIVVWLKSCVMVNSTVEVNRSAKADVNAFNSKSDSNDTKHTKQKVQHRKTP